MEINRDQWLSETIFLLVKNIHKSKIIQHVFEKGQLKGRVYLICSYERDF